MFKKILIPWDGSDLAAKIFPQVEEMAKCFQAEVTLFTVGNPAPAKEFISGAYDDIASQMKAQAEKLLAGAADTIKAKGIKASWVYTEGDPAQEIISYARDNQFDLIAMASHGKGEVAWMIGSVSEKVVPNATVPVLLLRVMKMKPPVSKEEYALGPD